MREEVSYVTVANQTAVSIGAFMYALMLHGGLHYTAVSVSVPHSHTIRNFHILHFIISGQVNIPFTLTSADQCNKRN
jgi:hypothetical protein